MTTRPPKMMDDDLSEARLRRGRAVEQVENAECILVVWRRRTDRFQTESLGLHVYIVCDSASVLLRLRTTAVSISKKLASARRGRTVQYSMRAVNTPT